MGCYCFVVIRCCAIVSVTADIPNAMRCNRVGARVAVFSSNDGKPFRCRKLSKGFWVVVSQESDLPVA